MWLYMSLGRPIDVPYAITDQAVILHAIMRLNVLLFLKRVYISLNQNRN